MRRWTGLTFLGAVMCADRLTPSARSALMSRIRGRDTAPERAVRRILTELGYRYRLQYKRAPGRPDVALPGRRKLIWVHGCYWHQHPGCPKAALPKSRREFWIPKLEGNHQRDLAVQAEARELGWDTLVAWECELRQPDLLIERLKRFLEGRLRSFPHQERADGANPHRSEVTSIAGRAVEREPGQPLLVETGDIPAVRTPAEFSDEGEKLHNALKTHGERSS